MARAMKDSGLDWLSKIPDNWEIKRNKQLFCEINERCENGEDHTLLSVSEYYGVAPKSEKIADGEFETRAESLDGYKICKADDIVMNIMLAWKKSTARSAYDGIISPAYCVFRKKIELSTEYYHYLFRTDVVASLFKRYSTGIIDSRLRLYPDKFFALYMPFPKVSEQQKIANFLDTKCASIDAVIEKTKASIEEYKKLKQAIITQAVTKGIRPNRKMKDSGVEWIGEIPEEWDTPSLKSLCRMQAGKNLVSEQIDEEETYPVYGGNGLRGYYKDYNCEGNKILVGRQGALCGNVHKVEGKIWATEHAVITDNNSNCCLNYLYYLLIGMNLNQYVSSTAAQPGLSVSKIQNIKTCLPAIEEQKEIYEYLDEKCFAIEKIIEQKKEVVEEQGLYKKSLIYEYVTGKKEVPNCY